MNDSYKQPDEERIKQILSETITVKPSAAFKKVKEKLALYEKDIIQPNDEIKVWFDKHSLKYTFPDFFDCLFSKAAHENRLDYIKKTIIFCDDDANIFGFEVGVPVSIYTIFESIPKYFS